MNAGSDPEDVLGEDGEDIGREVRRENAEFIDQEKGVALPEFRGEVIPNGQIKSAVSGGGALTESHITRRKYIWPGVSPLKVTAIPIPSKKFGLVDRF